MIFICFFVAGYGAAGGYPPQVKKIFHIHFNIFFITHVQCLNFIFNLFTQQAGGYDSTSETSSSGPPD